jgi:hypothetical protein
VLKWLRIWVRRVEAVVAEEAREAARAAEDASDGMVEELSGESEEASLKRFSRMGFEDCSRR